MTARGLDSELTDENQLKSENLDRFNKSDLEKIQDDWETL